VKDSGGIGDDNNTVHSVSLMDSSIACVCVCDEKNLCTTS